MSNTGQLNMLSSHHDSPELVQSASVSLQSDNTTPFHMTHSENQLTSQTFSINSNNNAISPTTTTTTTSAIATTTTAVNTNTIASAAATNTSLPQKPRIQCEHYEFDFDAVCFHEECFVPFFKHVLTEHNEENVLFLLAYQSVLGENEETMMRAFHLLDLAQQICTSDTTKTKPKTKPKTSSKNQKSQTKHVNASFTVSYLKSFFQTWSVDHVVQLMEREWNKWTLYSTASNTMSSIQESTTCTVFDPSLSVQQHQHQQQQHQPLITSPTVDVTTTPIPRSSNDMLIHHQDPNVHDTQNLHKSSHDDNSTLPAATPSETNHNPMHSQYRHVVPVVSPEATPMEKDVAYSMVESYFLSENASLCSSLHMDDNNNAPLAHGIHEQSIANVHIEHETNKRDDNFETASTTRRTTNAGHDDTLHASRLLSKPSIQEESTMHGKIEQGNPQQVPDADSVRKGEEMKSLHAFSSSRPLSKKPSSSSSLLASSLKKRVSVSVDTWKNTLSRLFITRHGSLLRNNSSSLTHHHVQQPSQSLVTKTQSTIHLSKRDSTLMSSGNGVNKDALKQDGHQVTRQVGNVFIPLLPLNRIQEEEKQNNRQASSSSFINAYCQPQKDASTPRQGSVNSSTWLGKGALWIQQRLSSPRSPQPADKYIIDSNSASKVTAAAAATPTKNNASFIKKPSVLFSKSSSSRKHLLNCTLSESLISSTCQSLPCFSISTLSRQKESTSIVSPNHSMPNQNPNPNHPLYQQTHIDNSKMSSSSWLQQQQHRNSYAVWTYVQHMQDMIRFYAICSILVDLFIDPSAIYEINMSNKTRTIAQQTWHTIQNQYRIMMTQGDYQVHVLRQAMQNMFCHVFQEIRFLLCDDVFARFKRSKVWIDFVESRTHEQILSFGKLRSLVYLEPWLLSCADMRRPYITPQDIQWAQLLLHDHYHWKCIYASAKNKINIYTSNVTILKPEAIAEYGHFHTFKYSYEYNTSAIHCLETFFTKQCYMNLSELTHVRCIDYIPFRVDQDWLSNHCSSSNNNNTQSVESTQPTLCNSPAALQTNTFSTKQEYSQSNQNPNQNPNQNVPHCNKNDSTPSTHSFVQSSVLTSCLDHRIAKDEIDYHDSVQDREQQQDVIHARSWSTSSAHETTTSSSVTSLCDSILVEHQDNDSFENADMMCNENRQNSFTEHAVVAKTTTEQHETTTSVAHVSLTTQQQQQRITDSPCERQQQDMSTSIQHPTTTMTSTENDIHAKQDMLSSNNNNTPTTVVTTNPNCTPVNQTRAKKPKIVHYGTTVLYQIRDSFPIKRDFIQASTLYYDSARRMYLYIYKHCDHNHAPPVPKGFTRGISNGIIAVTETSPNRCQYQAVFMVNLKGYLENSSNKVGWFTQTALVKHIRGVAKKLQGYIQDSLAKQQESTTSASEFIDEFQLMKPMFDHLAHQSIL